MSGQQNGASYVHGLHADVQPAGDTRGRVSKASRRRPFATFDWLVVDDGSTDDTQDFVASLSVEGNFRVVYDYQANSEKHVAPNRAAELAGGRFFATLDSDDEYVPNALERFLHHWDSIPGRVRGRSRTLRRSQRQRDRDAVPGRRPPRSRSFPASAS